MPIWTAITSICKLRFDLLSNIVLLQQCLLQLPSPSEDFRLMVMSLHWSLRLCSSCAACTAKLRGCCCSECMEAPRLRPVLGQDETYQRWHNYRDPPPPPPRPPGWVSRRALKRRRRKERRKEEERLKHTGASEVHCSSGGESSSEQANPSFVHQV